MRGDTEYASKRCLPLFFFGVYPKSFWTHLERFAFFLLLLFFVSLAQNSSNRHFSPIHCVMLGCWWCCRAQHIVYSLSVLDLVGCPSTSSTTVPFFLPFSKIELDYTDLQYNGGLLAFLLFFSFWNQTVSMHLRLPFSSRHTRTHYINCCSKKSI